MLIGEGLGHYLNDWIMNVSIRRNRGVFEAESRLWSVPIFLTRHRLTSIDYRACYVAIVLYVVGMVLIGVGFQHHLSIASFIIGWGMTEVATMVNTVAVCECYLSLLVEYVTKCSTDAYINDCFPRFQVRTSVVVSRRR